MSVVRTAVLVTVHNRVETTVRGLTKLAELADELSDEFAFDVFMVDDGSTDGTSARVREIPLNISIIPGSGSLYWNRGMALAFATAQASNKSFDAYMLYNDDVLLDENFIDFVREYKSMRRSILVGAFREPGTNEISYSGFVQLSRLRPTSFSKPEIEGTRVPVDTFNGNLVMIPADVFEELGGLDPKYTHAYGDIDLGLRARAIGARSFVYGRPVGVCERGPSLDSRIRAARGRARWNLLFGYPHGPGSHIRFTRKHGVPLLVPIYAAGEFTKRVKKLLWRRGA
ncbi:GT2 family glycosyltransferase [Mycolicibacterium iranicum]|uniref:GT2 family glycosyltransferase n=1 Tax=Mycolicibacterium iranicum TaxID=912594 RepID=A0A839Q5C5_MYCIR|nr:glycosyltransferase [Mycolicibacterium iranicum]MBB2991280.1 GT2 family glycosyltransferase [Mycolicibacterium iranicum]